MPSFKDIQDVVEKQEGFLKWLVEIWRTKNWVRVLLLLEALLVLFLNPFTIEHVVTHFNWKSPTWYGIAWGLAAAFVFIASLVAAKRSVRRSILPSRSERLVIRGLRPYTLEDAEVFSRLQREEILRECLISICDRDFRFGILCGESGSGKTSFLQAGLWPNILKHTHRCVYVKFSDLSPFDSIRQALTEQLEGASKRDETEFSTLLRAIANSDNTPLVLLFDQFEQFFVHRKRKADRKAFVDYLADWYQTKPSLPIKIVVSIRGDFSDRLIELQKAMGYSLGPQESFRLEKFEPAQATVLFCVIGEIEQISVDQKFVEEVVTLELASSDDGLISPVDVQVLAWMIAGQQSSEERAFNRVAYQRLGGVEGLLEMFLKRALSARETESRRQAAIKVLLALTDLERNTRAGSLTLPELTERLQGTLRSDEIAESVEWLARSDVRLVTANERKGVHVYELAHERLISAVRRLAGQELSAIDLANRLLDRRVNEWLGNDRSSRFFLSLSELRLIHRYKPYLSWGAMKSPKRTLVSLSMRRLVRRAGATLFVLLIPLSLVAWWYSSFGEIWQAKRDLMSISARVDDPIALAAASDSLAATKNFGAANSIINRSIAKLLPPFNQARISYDPQIFDPQTFHPNSVWADSVTAVATEYSVTGHHEDAESLLKRMFSVTGFVVSPSNAQIYANIGKERAFLEVMDPLTEEFIPANQDYDDFSDKFWAVLGIVRCYVILNQREKATHFLDRVFNVSERIVLSSRWVGNTLEVSDDTVTEPLTAHELQVRDMLKETALSTLHLLAGEKDQASKLANHVYKNVTATKLYNKEIVLQLSEVYSQLGNYERTDSLLNSIPSGPDGGGNVLWTRINVNLTLGVKEKYLPRLKFASEYLRQFENADTGPSSYHIFQTKLKILAAYDEFGADSEGRLQLRRECDSLEDYSYDRVDQVWLLAVVARILAQNGEVKESHKLLDRAQYMIPELSTKVRSELYPLIAEAYALNGDWHKARQSAQLTGNDASQVISLSRILKVWDHAR